jgi:hypothetical protein
MHKDSRVNAVWAFDIRWSAEGDHKNRQAFGDGNVDTRFCEAL